MSATQLEQLSLFHILYDRSSLASQVLAYSTVVPYFIVVRISILEFDK
jgi:hypothetical protein